MKIAIGTHEDGKPFHLPPDVVTSTLIVYGGKGMGKTNFGSVLVEEMSHAGLHWCALDPMGVWWGLRHSADGKGPGIECLILGGPHGDIPIEPTGGAIVADLVVDEDANVIVDFSRKANGEAWSVGEKVRFVRDFGRQLHRRQSGLIDGKRREPICVVMDEAARFIPQTIFKAERENPEAECLSVWSAIAEEGRNFGIGVVFLTQRSARLNKSVAELADVMVAFRTIGPNSVGAIVDWLGEHKLKKEIAPFVESLRSLPKGDALFISPGWLEFEGLVHVRLRETFDSSATPKPGERARKVTGKAAKPDLGKYAERMRETIERAKENDPSELKKQLASLRKELASAQKPQPAAPPQPKAAIDEKVIGLIVGIRDRQWRESLKVYRDAIVSTAKAFSSELATLACPEPAEKIEPPKNLKIGHAVEVTAPPKVERVVQHLAPRQPRSDVAKVASNGHLGKGEHKTLVATAQYPDGVERDTLTVLTGYKRSSRDTYIQRLREAGLVSIDGGRVVATQEGIETLGSDYEPLPTGDDLRAYWMQRLPQGERQTLEVLVEKWPESVPREVIDEATGYKRSSRDTYLQRLSSRRLVEVMGRGEVKASDNLFEG
jgi:hypothetical protein